MTANISIATLGVADLAASTEFYKKLGWKNTTASQESVTFLQGHSIILGLYGHDALAEDANFVFSPSKSDAPDFRGVAFALNLADESAVDAYFSHAVACGAKAQKQPEKVFWGGYSGYFADPDGHLWELAYNPFIPKNEEGQLTLDTL